MICYEFRPTDISVNYATLGHLNLLNIQDRVSQLRFNHVFSIYHGRAPSYLTEHFLLRSNYSNYYTRSASNADFVLPSVKHKQCESFYFNGIKDWNMLPGEIKTVLNTGSKFSFKRNVKKFLIDRGVAQYKSQQIFY